VAEVEGGTHGFTERTSKGILSWPDLIGPSIRQPRAEPSGKSAEGYAGSAPPTPTMDGPVEQGHDRKEEREGSREPPPLGPGEGRHPQNAATEPAAPSPGVGPREGPAPPAILPDWVDQVPHADRARLLAMPEPVRAETLCVWARFYGFDTS
jgi:hypothetical protein